MSGTSASATTMLRKTSAGRPGVAEDLLDGQRAAGDVGRVLEDRGVAGQQGGRGEAQDLPEREVPRHDREDDAQRLVGHPAALRPGVDRSGRRGSRAVRRRSSRTPSADFSTSARASPIGLPISAVISPARSPACLRSRAPTARSQLGALLDRSRGPRRLGGVHRGEDPERRVDVGARVGGERLPGGRVDRRDLRHRWFRRSSRCARRGTRGCSRTRSPGSAAWPCGPRTPGRRCTARRGRTSRGSSGLTWAW